MENITWPQVAVFLGLFAFMGFIFWVVFGYPLYISYKAEQATKVEPTDKYISDCHEKVKNLTGVKK